MSATWYGYSLSVTLGNDVYVIHDRGMRHMTVVGCVLGRLYYLKSPLIFYDAQFPNLLHVHPGHLTLFKL